MKRLITLFLFAIGFSAWVAAQVAPADTGAALGDTPRKRVKTERNVLGAPIYYDTLGNVLGATTPFDSVYHRPPHHFRNRLENEFPHFFYESMMLVSPTNFGIGGNLSILPQRWGGYVSGILGVRHSYLSMGPTLRLSDCGDDLDWHLYGGVVVSRRLGAELGIRMSLADLDDFCWYSVSMGIGYANREVYVTVGLSLMLTPSILLFCF